MLLIQSLFHLPVWIWQKQWVYIAVVFRDTVTVNSNVSVAMELLTGQLRPQSTNCCLEAILWRMSIELSVLSEPPCLNTHTHVYVQVKLQTSGATSPTLYQVWYGKVKAKGLRFNVRKGTSSKMRHVSVILPALLRPWFVVWPRFQPSFQRRFFTFKADAQQT